MAGREILGNKTPVTKLQEICAKVGQPLPVYTYRGEEIPGGNLNAKLFMYTVNAGGQEAEGSARSKQEAKHEAAWALIKTILKLDDSKMSAENETPEVLVAMDKVTEVRNICVQRGFPLPIFANVRSSGPAHAPEFEYECRIKDICKRGIHSTKKGAKQLACLEMIKTLQAMHVDDESLTQLVPMDEAIQMEDDDMENIIRTYREYTQSDVKRKLGVPFIDRHRFFEDMDENKLAAVRKICNDPVETIREKCSLIPKALGLKFKFTLDDSVLSSIEGRKFYSFELVNNDFDCFIIGIGDALYDNVYEYFLTMLNITVLS